MTEEQSSVDIDHLKWAIVRRSEIQFTLLALYEVVSGPPLAHPILIDHLIAAAFSLWRAVFLAETDRDWHAATESKKKFLAKLVADNAITYADDKSTRAWTVGFYMENAKLRLLAAYRLSSTYKPDHSIPDSFWFQGMVSAATRMEWEAAHTALITLLNALPSTIKLPIPVPTSAVTAYFPPPPPPPPKEP